MRDIGISWGGLEKYIEDNIYTLPGIFDHREKLTILLTGSRAIGRYSENSDVDIDIVCPRNSYNQIQAEMFKRNLTGNLHNAFYRLPEAGWDKYFGERIFFIIEGRSFPYSEKLPSFVAETKLGKRFKPFLDKILNMAIGLEQGEKSIWERLDKAIELILYGNISQESIEFFDACDKAVIEAGIDEAWVKSGYDNVDELLHGKLGPIP